MPAHARGKPVALVGSRRSGVQFVRIRATVALVTLAAAMVAPELDAKPLPARNPVLLIHGFKDTSAKMQPMARHLRRQGWEAHTPALQPSWGEVRIEALADQLNRYVEAHFEPAQRIDIVGFSMGGIVARWYLQRLGGAARVQRFITLSAPHRGTWLANLCPAGLNRPGIRQLTINSELLLDLNRDAASLAGVQFTSIWTPLDLMILPASSSRIALGKDVTMWVLAHPLMVWEPRCHRRIAKLLME
jgi:triacylglycerol lipase